ncbi:MAG: hypothetical protein J1F40_07500 [Prevotellaceae bacterium]|nr:hypothetical protein [Prevotellaceae bacterium]
MKKIYEAPEMLVEVVCVESLLVESLPVIGGSGAPTIGNLDDILTKDRKDESDLW